MNKIPKLGLGTFRLKDEVLKKSLESGIKVGFRHIDTAQIYENEADIGSVLKEIDLKRSELFITSKIWTSNLSKEKLIKSLKQSLSELNTSYLDLTLIHWPSPNDEVPLEETLNELMKAKDLGLTKEIGLSNFTAEQVAKAVEIVGAQNIATNQIEVHPFLQNRKVIKACNDFEIQVTAYMPLAYGEVIKNEQISKIAKKHSISNAEVSLSWLLDQGFVVIPSSTNEEHLRSNVNVKAGVLDQSDLKVIASLEKNFRIANPDFAPEWD